MILSVAVGIFLVVMIWFLFWDVAVSKHQLLFDSSVSASFGCVASHQRGAT